MDHRNADKLSEEIQGISRLFGGFQEDYGGVSGAERDWRGLKGNLGCFQESFTRFSEVFGGHSGFKVISGIYPKLLEILWNTPQTPLIHHETLLKCCWNPLDALLKRYCDSLKSPHTPWKTPELWSPITPLKPPGTPGVPRGLSVDYYSRGKLLERLELPCSPLTTSGTPWTHLMTHSNHKTAPETHCSPK